MATTTGTLEALALHLGKLLRPLEKLLGPEMFFRLGVPLPKQLLGDATLLTKLTDAATLAGQLDPKITALAAAITANDSTSIISAGVDLTAQVAQLVAKLVEAGNALGQAVNTLPAADRAALQAFAGELAERTLEYMIIGYLAEQLPSLTSAFALLGIIDMDVDADPTLEASKPPPADPTPRRFHIDRLPQLLNDPATYLQRLFGWGANTFDGDLLLSRLHAFMESLGVPASLYRKPNKPPVLEAYVVSAQADTSVNPPGLKFDLALPAVEPFDKTISFSSLWKGTVHAKPTFNAGLEVDLRPPFTLGAKPPTGSVELELLLGLKAQKDAAADPVVILGLTGGSRLQAKSLSGSIGIDAKLDAAGGSVVPVVQLGIEEGKLVIDASEGDGFIQELLAGVHLESDFSVLGTWDPEKGLRLQGHAGVEVFIPVHIDLSVLLIDGIYFSIGISDDAPVEVGLATRLTAKLGPLVAVVDRLGASAVISFPPGGRGRLGPADVDFRFLPPRGVGLSVDAGVIKGGGFLYLDPDKGEYFGALELSFQGIIALKAVGIVNTKMPDGKPGFALLILITAEFTPIQLGFGFTLNGVGGLLGVNRTTDIDALKAGVRTGAVASILFPEDVVANIGRIISDLKAIFPIADGHFLIGPMGKVGWGTPTLISLELGIIIDIPVPRLVILGVLRCILPDEDAALLALQVNFAGGIDFDQGLIWFDASLFDSRIVFLTLTGDMALRIGWKNPMFIISVGGFHPAFHEIPPDLTSMQRISVSLLSGDNPRLGAKIYFAITSNSVQSGAKVELYAEACGFNVYGYLGYDLLVQLRPLYFVADIYAGLALRRGTDEIAGIHVQCELSGPTPWHAKGDASIHILLFDVSVGFDVTWGDAAPAQPIESVDVLALIAAALDDKRNWKADLPANTNQGVSLKKIELAADDIIVHPFGILSVSQKVVPLDLTIDKFGDKKPSSDTRFHLTSAAGATAPVTEEFALANFVRLSDAEKIARKSFEALPSGLRLTPDDDTAHGAEMHKDVTYELSYVHKKKRSVVFAGVVKMFSGLFATLIGGNAIGKSKYAVARRTPRNPPIAVETGPGKFMVVKTADLQPYAENLIADSEAEAYDMQRALLAQDPSLAGAIQVVAGFEAA